jgi:hypothetical protein
MAPFKLILLIAGLLCFILAATNIIIGENRLRVMSLGLACYTGSLIVS